MSIIVQRILVSHLKYFEACSAPSHVTHAHSKEMGEKSDMVTIGIIQENPGTSDGAFSVLDNLHAYVPFPDGMAKQPHIVPVHGDAGSFLGIMSSQRSRQSSVTPTERLQGMWPVPGELHRRFLLNQDTMNLLYAPTSSADRGTLANICSVFGLKGVKPKVTESFNHVEDMIHLTTKGLVCLAAIELLDLSSVTEQCGLPEDEVNQKLINVSDLIVSFFWHQTPMSDVMDIIEAEIPGHRGKFCKCGKPSGIICFFLADI